MALPPTGTIDRITVDAMNVPAGVRLNQLQVNLKRLQTLSRTTASRYVDVNIPSAQVEAVQNGQVVQRHAAVVGKNDLQTPELSSKIVEINFNPYWYVPRSIVYNDLVPKGREFARRGQDILAAYRMEAFDAAGNQVSPQSIDWFGDQVLGYNFRQQPWEENSLGFVKINFPNKDSVYMHDTPLKSLFGRNVRFESHGCVRVHDVAALVAWLLNNNSGWDIQRVMTMKQTGEQINDQADQADRRLFHLCHRLGDPGWRRQFQARHLRPRRLQRDDRIGVLGADRPRHKKGHPWGWPFALRRRRA